MLTGINLFNKLRISFQIGTMKQIKIKLIIVSHFYFILLSNAAFRQNEINKFKFDVVK